MKGGRAEEPPGRARPIHRPRPRPCGRSPEAVKPSRQPGQRSLRPDARGGCPDVANRPAADADSGPAITRCEPIKTYQPPEVDETALFMSECTPCDYI